ncbi:Maltoporin N-terminal extension [Aeromonas veronii]|nr:Maltoporin N-terminal extension [Aeromonas veronii]
MFKSKLALAVALGLGMSSPLWAAQASVAGESVEARLAALEARVQAAEARAEAAENRASQAEVKASAASEQAPRVSSFMVTLARACWSTAMVTAGAVAPTSPRPVQWAGPSVALATRMTPTWRPTC